MTKIALEISTLTLYDTVEEARQAGQSVETIIGKTGNSVRLHEVGTFRSIPLYAPTVDRSRFTRGLQEVEGRIGSLVKGLRSAIPELAEVEFTEGVKVLDRQVWTVNYQQLFDNVIQHVSNREEGLTAFRSAVALTLQNEFLRGVK
jgi:hypothetical protein